MQMGLSPNFNYMPDTTGAGNPVAGNMINIDKDFIMGVVTFETQVVAGRQTILPVTDNEFGVYLSADDKTWILSQCPEPSSLTLLALGTLILVRMASTRVWRQHRRT